MDISRDLVNIYHASTAELMTASAAVKQMPRPTRRVVAPPSPTPPTPPEPKPPPPEPEPPPPPVTWNPSDKASRVTLSNGNLTATNTGSTFGDAKVRATRGLSSGKHLFSLKAGQAINHAIGVSNASEAIGTDFLGGSANGIATWTNTGDSGDVYYNDAVVADTGITLAANDVADVAVDLDARLIWWRTNGGPWNGSPTANPATGTGGIAIQVTGTLYPTVQLTDPNDQTVANFGASAFTHAPPAGFSAWQVA